MYIFIFGNYYLKYNLTSGEATVHNSKYRLANRDVINKKKIIAYYKNKGCNLKPAELLLELEINKQEF